MSPGANINPMSPGANINPLAPGVPLPQDSASNASAHSRPKPKPRKQRVPPSPPAEATYDVPDLSPVGGRGTNISPVGGCGQPSRHSDSNDYDDPDALELPARRLPTTPNGTYDDILDVIGQSIPVEYSNTRDLLE